MKLCLINETNIDRYHTPKKIRLFGQFSNKVYQALSQLFCSGRALTSKLGINGEKQPALLLLFGQLENVTTTVAKAITRFLAAFFI